MAANDKGGGTNIARILSAACAAGAVVALAGLAIIKLEDATVREQEERDRLSDAFAVAHAVTLPPELYNVQPGVYSGVEVQTPQGPETCKASVAQDRGYANTRHIVLSDCRPR